MPEDTAVINQPDATTAFQHAFDVVTKQKPKAQEAPKPVAPTPIAVEPTKPVKPKVEVPAQATQEKPKEEHKLPSFISIETEPEPPKPAEPEIKLEDLPVEPPATASENEKINWKKTRTLLEKQEKEIKTLREKQSDKAEVGKELSTRDTERLQQLEQELATAKSQLNRYGLENHQSFVSEVIQPMQASYQEAKRIIRDAGGNEALLDKALSLQGKEHYAVMDEILSELPESAKGELSSSMRDFRKYAQKRAQEIANAPKALAERQKRDATEQRNYLENQKQDLEKMFDSRVKNLREQYKFEPLIESQDEDTKWWNNIPRNVIEKAKKVVFENQDVGIAMDVAIMGVAAPTLRDLWLASEKRAVAAEKELRAIRGSEPTIGSGGSTAKLPDKVDIKEPIGTAFMKILKAQTGR